MILFWNYYDIIMIVIIVIIMIIIYICMYTDTP